VPDDDELALASLRRCALFQHVDDARLRTIARSMRHRRGEDRAAIGRGRGGDHRHDPIR
jgi:hypothetical protein